jgi:hypothetical protein
MHLLKSIIIYKEDKMIKLLPFSELKQKLIDDPDSLFYIVSRNKLDYVKFSQVQNCPVLAPTVELSRKLKLGDISGSEFKNKYAHELQSPIVIELLRHFRTEAQDKHLYLVEDPKFTGALLPDILDKI